MIYTTLVNQGGYTKLVRSNFPNIHNVLLNGQVATRLWT